MTKFALSVADYPDIDIGGFIIEHSANSSGEPCQWLSLSPETIEASPFNIHSDDETYQSTKSTVRDLFRHAGYKPTGRGKPASEYLVSAVAKGTLGAINPIVDILNAVSLHSCLPISVVDLDSCQVFDEEKLHIAPAAENTEYAFNASGQTMKLDGLLSLHDKDGPIANAVKDSQRTKTSEGTRRSLVIVWGTKRLDGHTAQTANWFKKLVEEQNLGKCLALNIA